MTSTEGWGGALISAVLGTELPGPGTIFINQSQFEAPLEQGETVIVRARCDGKTGEEPPDPSLHLP